jgi:hypothetical protein
MAIGLSSQQLVQVFFDSFSKRQSEMSLENSLADMGLSPMWATLKTEMKKQDPSTDLAQVERGIVLSFALMDTIVRNNEALAKSIPHLD